MIGAGQGDVTFNGSSLIGGEYIITGSRHSTRSEFIETMEIMARGLVKPVVGRRVHFTEVESLFDDITRRELLGRGALTYEERLKSRDQAVVCSDLSQFAPMCAHSRS